MESITFPFKQNHQGDDGMSQLLVLGPPFNGHFAANQNFKGVNRESTPSPPSNKLKLEKFNQIFDILLENIDFEVGNGSGNLKNLSVAKRIADGFMECDEEGKRYEVIEIVDPGKTPKYKGYFLGFDVLWKNEGNDSHILTYIDEQTRLGCEKLCGKERDILEKKYATAINQYVLFGELESAERFAKELYEITNGEIESEILGIYKVTE
jgi:hypothetical protein